ncbi:type II secretion system F family protein [Halocalculus aciditolerans]|uniref:Type II secretion system protein GspF domain-containing protein n=1 Tax=Halocalculus aciditolerans TaxID=1383812 RepID=A0A830FD64_9EURY|nr:type II secretion system F family protein [Halocalculus aciditolerans]GGL63452.1 hypothetical protein GCM10009039_21700 [Halocalculus aciditolerans]
MSTNPLDRGLYALFSRHADRDRHAVDRRRYRVAGPTIGFDLFVARLYGVAWLAALLAAAGATLLVLSLPPATEHALAALAARVAPDAAPEIRVPRLLGAFALALLVGVTARAGTVAAVRAYLRWAARARRVDVERTLPGAVRYLRVLASGEPDRRELLAAVADRPSAYGGTAAAFRDVLNRAAVTGSLAGALRDAARVTPSRDLLAPFLLQYREHAAQGSDAVEGYLRLEARMLANRQDRARRQAEGFLELLSELFVVLLVLPALLVVVVTALGVLAPGLGREVLTPLGGVTLRALVVYGSAGFVLVVGLAAAALVDTFRLAGYGGVRHARSPGVDTLRNALSNPVDAIPVFGLFGLAVAVGLALGGDDLVTAGVLGYDAAAIPIGLVAVRRARLDDAKDRELTDFVHAVAGHVGLGRPFPRAVERVAAEESLGPLAPDVADLAFRLGLSTDEGDQRADALDAFVESVGTPLATQTVGLLSGALDAGSDAETAFETLQSEVGHLHHEKQTLRAALLAYVAVGWTTALLVVGIVVAVDTTVLDSFAQLSAVGGSMSAVGFDAAAVDPARAGYRFYVVTLATMLACGWFAGTASRGPFEALLHSGLLSLAALAVFAGVGVV